jgi:GNAT superfamily N-acetyltransferase
VIALTPDRWLSDVMKRPVHRVSVTPGAADALDGPHGFYYTRLLTDDVAALARLGGVGFGVVDTNITLERDLNGIGETDVRVRAAAPSDRDAVMAIARNAFRYSRFHLDPSIPKALADDIKAQWAGNFFAGARGDHMLVAESGGGIAGFLQLIHAPDEALVIDLIAVVETARGRGLGGAMIRTAERLARRARMRVGTQVANMASLRFYENLAFRATTSSYVMHLHA